ncbi:MAG: hypothetical protein ACM30E_01860 [Nitrososphaerales archaeon]
MTVVAVLGTFETAAENSEVAARHIEAAGSKAIRVHRDEPLASKIRKLAASQIVYGTGFGFAEKLWALSRAMGKRTVNHWVGTDVLLALEDDRHRRMTRGAARFVQHHLTFAPWLAQELESLGIIAEVAPFTTPVRFEQRATPGDPGVLAYLPDDRADFYGAEIVRSVARQLPDVPFGIVAGTAERQPPGPNVTYLGWIHDIKPFYERYPILLRLARHDGLPKMVLEALAYGNQVVFEYEFPGCHHATTEAEALVAVRSILAAGCPINTTGSQVVRERYSNDQLSRRLLEAIGVPVS